ncbi:hypothetical protein PI124_g18564 [Phytophthora idaei]|nr:hypothetical protein PI125_g19344 [Phytophthora idaei]KAG3136387.1 hypothetical protein PI126_g17836 [Phytophthora idaei]KAG3236423.1 hypothetical protein PI124_g18564 [Phytophthora idaei]
MRLLLRALLATLVIVLSSCEAASVDTNKPLQRAQYSTLISRGLAVDNTLVHDKRFLRDESKIQNLTGGDRDEAEERGVAQKIVEKTKGLAKNTVEALKRLKARYLKKEAKILERRFKKLAKEGKSYADVKDQWSSLLYSGWWSTPPGFKRFLRFYDAWLRKNSYTHLAKQN